MGYNPRILECPESAKPGLAIAWEESPCLLCGGHNWNPVVEAPDQIPGGTGLWFLVVQCRDCGLCFTNPRPNEETIGQFYPQSYQPHDFRPDRRRRWWHRLHDSWSPAKDWRKRLPLHGLGRLLDFGCGAGVFLNRMHEQGWEVLGLDANPEAVRRIHAELGLPALDGSLPHPDLVPGTFDVITMWHALEHVHQPLEVLREAHRLLAPGGKLLLASPNIDSLPFRWFGRHWYALDLPRHLVHFSPWTLRLMLHRAGFKVGRFRMLRHSKWFRTSARQFCRQPGMASTWQRLLGLRGPANLVTWFSFLTRQSDCIMACAVKK